MTEIPSFGIIGGGITGLCTAYYLVNRGYPVTVIEREQNPGGLARAIPFIDTEIDRYYHFICRHDANLLKLIEELGISHKVKWRQTAMDYHVNGVLYPFTDPKDIFRFKPLSFWNKLRFGVSMIPFFLNLDWKKLDYVPNDQWLLKWSGQSVYDVIWKPLMVKKYHHRHKEVPAAWVWGRTRRRSRSRRGFPRREYLGYIEGGTKTLLLTMAEMLKSKGVNILLNSPVTAIHANEKKVSIQTSTDRHTFDRVVSTLPAPVTSELTEGFPQDYRERLGGQEYLAVVCPVVAVEGRLARKYWTNICETDIPYLGVIEFSQLNQDPNYNGMSIAYMPFYIWPDHALWTASDDEVLKIAAAHLEELFPWFNRNQIKSHLVHRDRYSQPLITTGHLKRMLPFATPRSDMFILDSSMIYPEDRGLNNCVRLAERFVSENF
jgi:protoporphyrinogen oxidase